MCGRSFCEKGALRIHQSKQNCEESDELCLENIVDHGKASDKNEMITEPEAVEYDPSAFLETEIYTMMIT